MICGETKKSILGFLESRFECMSMPPYLRLITPFQYYDGDFIEIFLEYRSEMNVVVFSDLGETARRMAEMDFNWNTHFARTMKAQILESTGTSWDKGVVYMFSQSSAPEIGESVMFLIHALQRLDSLVITKREQLPKTFRDTVEQFLKAEKFDLHLNHAVMGSSGTFHHLPFFVNSNCRTLIKTVSSPTKGGVDFHIRSTYTAYGDIGLLDKTYLRAVLYDERGYSLDDEQSELIKQVADWVGPFDERPDLTKKMKERGRYPIVS